MFLDQDWRPGGENPFERNGFEEEGEITEMDKILMTLIGIIILLAVAADKIAPIGVTYFFIAAFFMIYGIAKALSMVLPVIRFFISGPFA